MSVLTGFVFGRASMDDNALSFRLHDGTGFSVPMVDLPIAVGVATTPTLVPDASRVSLSGLADGAFRWYYDQVATWMPSEWDGSEALLTVDAWKGEP